jgi:hypothetical protein
MKRKRVLSSPTSMAVAAASVIGGAAILQRALALMVSDQKSTGFGRETTC